MDEEKMKGFAEEVWRGRNANGDVRLCLYAGRRSQTPVSGTGPCGCENDSEPAITRHRGPRRRSAERCALQGRGSPSPWWKIHQQNL